MSKELPIVCKPTKWFIWRALLMLLMFGGFAVYFLYDWKVGYPKKNLVIAHYEAFNEAGRAWAIPENQENWEEYASKQKIPYGDDLTIYPEGTDFEAAWPEILADKEGMASKNDEGLWKDYTGEKQWDQEVDLEEDPKPAYKIREQLYAALVCLVLTLISLYFFLRTRGRAMKVDEEAYYEPGGTKIPYSSMKVIDKRKWETKGLATITYEDEAGKEEKAKVDGLVYGQFKEEEGAPAEALFQHVLANFEGELIELVEEEDEEEGEEGAEAQEDEAKEGSTE